MIFSFLYNNQQMEVEADSVVEAIIEIVEYSPDTCCDTNDFELLE